MTAYASNPRFGEMSVENNQYGESSLLKLENE